MTRERYEGEACNFHEEENAATEAPKAEDPGTVTVDSNLNFGKVDWTPMQNITGVRPAVLGAGLRRFSPFEWRTFNNSFPKSAVLDKLSQDIQNLVANVAAEVDAGQLETNLKMRTSAQKLYKMTDFLGRMVIELSREAIMLERLRKRMHRALAGLQRVEQVNQESIALRRTRPGQELVRDILEEELWQEQGLCKEVRQLYRAALSELEAMIHHVRTAKVQAERRGSDKIDSYGLETQALCATNASTFLQFQPGIVRNDEHQSSPETLERFDRETRAMLTKLAAESANLRQRLNAPVLATACKDMCNLRDRIESALKRRVTEETNALAALERQLRSTVTEQGRLEAMASGATELTKKHDCAMKLAQTRLKIRSQKQRAEYCRDEPQAALLKEVDKLRSQRTSLDTANNNIQSAVAATSCVDLIAAISKKRATLDIEKRVGQIRSAFPQPHVIFGR